MFQWIKDWLRRRRVRYQISHADPVRAQSPMNRNVNLLTYYILQVQPKRKK